MIMYRRAKKINLINTRIDPTKYAKELAQAMGHTEALRVAGNCAGTAKSVVENLAVASTFVDPAKARRDLSFWTNVKGYLARRDKSADKKKGAGHAKA